MGKHRQPRRPLPDDPDEKIAERKRRFAAYRKLWKAERRERERAENLQKFRARRALLVAAHKAGFDLVTIIEDMTDQQIQKALRVYSVTPFTK